jgi:poly-gamma-glutamate capsule biosynthesis protein CapA/YwtB (metallophosphatase superfamily)
MPTAPLPPALTLFLCGDVMTGRGIDQILPHPGKPRLFEACVHSALGYVQLAEEKNGPIARPVDFAYPWGDALDAWRRAAPDLRIVNLETAVTTSDDAWPGKGIHYRMHPANLPCLAAARIDCCVLANNHVMDWGGQGLKETLCSLRGAGAPSPTPCSTRPGWTWCTAIPPTTSKASRSTAASLCCTAAATS